MVIFFATANGASQPLTDQQRLSRAVEYFQSGKYHEALLLFKTLDKAYKLNPRFLAYIGVCHFYDNNYTEAAQVLATMLPSIEKFAPQERSVYYYCAAESNYRAGHYPEAIPLFESQLLVCHDNEKGDAMFRIALCYLHTGNVSVAQEYLQQAIAYFRRYNSPDKLLLVEKELEKL